MGIQGERWRVAWARREWRARRAQEQDRRSPYSQRDSQRRELPQSAAAAGADAAEQLRQVMAAEFERRRLLSRPETEVFNLAEQAVARSGRPWRVMAHVCLGEILKSPDSTAFRAVNSKRVDMLIVCGRSLPIAAIEYQGWGHHQGSAPARDAVKKEALRKAGVRYIEVTPEHGPDHLACEIARLARVEAMKPVTRPDRNPA